MRMMRLIMLFITLGTTISLHAQRIKSGTASFHVNNVPVEEVDTVPPVINILNPALKLGVPFHTKKDQFDLILEVSDKSEIRFVSVNRSVPVVNEKGQVGTTLFLVAGENEVRIAAMDVNENRQEQVYIVNYMPPVVTLADRIHLESKYYGLLIGINEYENDFLEDLDNPLADASALYRVLTRYYNFDEKNTVFLRNPRRNDIIQQLNLLREKVTPDDNLLIFYAGHGSYDEEANIGYWLPSDASTNTADWLENSTLMNQIRGIKSKHTLLITDACFAGSIFTSRAVSMPIEIKYDMVYNTPSRKVLTSGNMTEVPDESAFVKYLIKQLEDNQSEYISAEELYNALKDPVIFNNSTLPRYGDIPNVGSEGGDFVFLKDNRE
ncbi:MAG: caspase family protein [Bacteroidales bacterium]